MADTVANRSLYTGSRRHVIRSQFTIDGTEASDLVCVDKSALTGPDGTEPGRLIIEKIEYHITGCQILLEFDHDTDDAIVTLSGDGIIDFTDGGKFQGFVDPASTGATGDIVATTLATDSGDTASLVFYVRKKD
jgi:hypothetical protein